MASLTIFSAYLVLVSSLTFHVIVCIDIPSEWLSYLQEMTKKIDTEPWSPVCIQHSGILKFEERTKICGNVFPDYIFWDPLVQFPSLYATINRCVSEECANKL